MKENNGNRRGWLWLSVPTRCAFVYCHRSFFVKSWWFKAQRKRQRSTEGRDKTFGIDQISCLSQTRRAFITIKDWDFIYLFTQSVVLHKRNRNNAAPTLLNSVLNSKMSPSQEEVKHVIYCNQRPTRCSQDVKTSCTWMLLCLKNRSSAPKASLLIVGLKTHMRRRVQQGGRLLCVFVQAGF